MAVEAVVALMLVKLDTLLSNGARLLGVRDEIEIKHIRGELDQMRPFLKDADIKQKKNENVREWMEDIRDICFDVYDVIDILGQGQAAQGRLGFVERLKRCISDQITRYKVGKEIKRIKLNIKAVSKSRMSYDIDGGRRETNSLSSQAHSCVSTPPGEPEKVGLQGEVGQQLNGEEPRSCDGTRDINEGELEASSPTAGVSTLLGDSEAVGFQEGKQLIKDEPGPYGGTRDIDEGRLEASSLAPEASFSVPPEKREIVITTVDGQLTKEERTRDIEGGGQEASSSSRNLQGEVGQQLNGEEPRSCDGTGDINEGELEASSPTLLSTLLGDSEEVGLQEGKRLIRRRRNHRNSKHGNETTHKHNHPWFVTNEQLIKRSFCSSWDSQAIDWVSTPPGRQEPICFSLNSQAQSWVSTPPGEPEKVGLQGEVGQQLIGEEPRSCDGTRDINEGELEASSSTPRLKADRGFSTHSSTLFMASTKKITLKSSDGETFHVDEAVALQSQIIKHMIEDDCADYGIPLPNVTGKILDKVIEYCKKHVEMPKDADDRATEDELKAWDAEFVKVDQGVLFDLIMAANYLNIESLKDLTCQTVADMIKGKTPDEIKKILGLKNDYTPEEEEAIRGKTSGPLSDPSYIWNMW